MKVTAIIILLLLAIAGATAPVYAQSFTVDSAKKSVDFSGDFGDAEIQLSAVKKLPAFSGGKKAWQDFLRSNINIAVPFSNKAIPGTYKLLLRFMVRSNGKLSDIGADTNCGYGMESEVIRCIKKSADWIPAETSSGRKVSFTIRTAVTFIVKQNDVSISFE
jgi:hypothetical protein